MDLTKQIYPYKWQYTGVAPFDQITHWCYINIQGFSIIHETIYFSRLTDYQWFLLKWV